MLILLALRRVPLSGLLAVPLRCQKPSPLGLAWEGREDGTTASSRIYGPFEQIQNWISRSKLNLRRAFALAERTTAADGGGHNEDGDLFAAGATAF